MFLYFKLTITPEKSVLNKGLNFATIIKRILYLDLIAPIEDAALKIPKAQVSMDFSILVCKVISL